MTARCKSDEQLSLLLIFEGIVCQQFEGNFHLFKNASFVYKRHFPHQFRNFEDTAWTAKSDNLDNSDKLTGSGKFENLYHFMVLTSSVVSRVSGSTFKAIAASVSKYRLSSVGNMHTLSIHLSRESLEL